MNPKIVNKTRKNVLCENPRWAITAWQQAKGFMFERPKGGIVFLFFPARPVRLHMWFVFGAIDVLALDGEGKVVALKEEFKPWHYWSAGTRASAVLELPAGTIKKSGTKLRDVIGLPKMPFPASSSR
jgi:uncharacterized membrane protein (UPF0127 family)